MITKTYQSLSRTVGPSEEPVTLAEARDQCEIIASDQSHDVKLNRYIQSAREQVETDTGYKLITQTFTLSLDEFPEQEPLIQIPARPLQSVSGITYYDSDNAQQTLSTDVYGVDVPRRMVYRKVNQTWPASTVQHNNIQVTFNVGFGAASNVPSLIKQALLLQITKWFVHRGEEMSDASKIDRAYEALIKRILRTSYP